MEHGGLWAPGGNQTLETVKKVMKNYKYNYKIAFGLFMIVKTIIRRLDHVTGWSPKALRFITLQSCL